MFSLSRTMSAADADKSRTSILSAINSWLASSVRHPVLRILEGKRPSNDAPSFFMEVPRIILVLKGRATFKTVEHGNETTFGVRSGQLLYLGEHTWICPVPRTSYQSLGVVFHEKGIRIAIHSRTVRPARGAPNVESKYLWEWRASETLGAKGLHLHALLKEPLFELIQEEGYLALLRILMAELVRIVEHSPQEHSVIQSVLWQSVRDYISDHWSDASLSRMSAARFFQCHPNHFSRFFCANAKVNFRSYINEIRLERSLKFLCNLQYNVTDAAQLCGFCDAQYFIRCFRERYGITPGLYRKRYVA